MPEKFNENRRIARPNRQRPREALTFPACAGKIATILMIQKGWVSSMLEENIRTGLTFDDVLLVPRASSVLPRDVDTSTMLTPTSSTFPC